VIVDMFFFLPFSLPHTFKYPPPSLFFFAIPRIPTLFELSSPRCFSRSFFAPRTVFFPRTSVFLFLPVFSVFFFSAMSTSKLTPSPPRLPRSPFLSFFWLHTHFPTTHPREGRFHFLFRVVDACPYFLLLFHKNFAFFFANFCSFLFPLHPVKSSCHCNFPHWKLFSQAPPAFFWPFEFEILNFSPPNARQLFFLFYPQSPPFSNRWHPGKRTQLCRIFVLIFFLSLFTDFFPFFFFFLLQPPSWDFIPFKFYPSPSHSTWAGPPLPANTTSHPVVPFLESSTS